MTSVPETLTTVQFDTALRTLADKARTRYAGEHMRIDRGLVIALNHGVTLNADGSADVQSCSNAEVVYHVAHGTCDCPDFQRAPDGRCKHVWARCFVRKAMKQLDDQTVPQQYFATYYNPAGEAIEGVATVDKATGKTLFVPEDGGEPLYPSPVALCLGGHIATYEAQRIADGNLVRKVCGY